MEDKNLFSNNKNQQGSHSAGFALPNKSGFLFHFIEYFSWKRFVLQLLLVLLIIFGLHFFYINTIDNLTRQHIASGFGFLDMRAGITIPDSLIPYSADSTYSRALLVGLINTVFMSLLCIIFATIAGFLIAFGRLSKNWLLRKICFVYVEVFRNIPVLLVILFFYFGVLQQYLPSVRNSLQLPFDIFINQRGVYFPAIHFSTGIWSAQNFILPFILCVLALFTFFVPRKIDVKARLLRILLRFLVFILVSAALLSLLSQFTIEVPHKGRFNIAGGGSVSPEFFALFLGLSFYSAALIAETVRAGIEGVDKGLKDAARSLGMKESLSARLIVIPLALRIIVPPLSGQYMNIAKNTSLAVAIGYSDLMRVGNTVLIQTNQSIEVVCIWIIAYLSICLIISALMNLLNTKLLYAVRVG